MPINTATLLTVRDVAERLGGVSTETVCGLIATGSLKAVNVGLGKKKPRWRIRPEDLEVFLAGRTTTARLPAARRRRQKLQHVIEFF